MTVQYALLVYESASDRDLRGDPERWAPLRRAYAVYTRALVEAGVMRGGEALELPHTATVVSDDDGRARVQDGPFADTKEQLGGIFVIACADLDEALAWAARCPAVRSGGKVEVRPTMTAPSVDG